MTRKNKGILITTIVLVLSLTLFNLFFFLFPMKEQVYSQWPAYVITTLLMLFVWYAIYKNIGDGLNDQIFEQDIVIKAISMLFIQLIIDVFTLILCAFYVYPFIIAILMELGMTAIFILSLFSKKLKK